MIWFLVAVIVILCFVIRDISGTISVLDATIARQDDTIKRQRATADKRDAKINKLIYQAECLKEDQEDMWAGEYHGMGN